MKTISICIGLLFLFCSATAFAQEPAAPASATAPTAEEKPAAEPKAKPAATPRPAEKAAQAPKAEIAADRLWSGLGGQILPSGDDALRAWLGFPGIGLAYVTPVTRTFQIAPYFQFNYGTALGISAPVVGVDLGVELKVQFYDKDKLSFAFVANPAFRFMFDEMYGKDEFGFGMRFGPRVEGSYAAMSNLNVLFKAGLPFEMIYHPTFMFYLPIAFGAGVEFKLNNDVNLYFTSEAGPLVWAVDGLSDVDVWYRGEMGCEYRF